MLLAELGTAHAAVLGDYHYAHGVRADLLARLRRVEDAAAAYATAIEVCDNVSERTWPERWSRDIVGDTL